MTKMVRAGKIENEDLEKFDLESPITKHSLKSCNQDLEKFDLESPITKHPLKSCNQLICEKKIGNFLSPVMCEIFLVLLDFTL